MAHERHNWRNANFNPYKRDDQLLFAEVVSRRQHPKPRGAVDPLAEREDPAPTLEITEVLGKSPEGRARWLQKVMPHAAVGRVKVNRVYDIVAHPRFAKGLSVEDRRQLDALLRAHLELFSQKQRRFLQSEASGLHDAAEPQAQAEARPEVWAEPEAEAGAGAPPPPAAPPEPTGAGAPGSGPAAASPPATTDGAWAAAALAALIAGPPAATAAAPAAPASNLPLAFARAREGVHTAVPAASSMSTGGMEEISPNPAFAPGFSGQTPAPSMFQGSCPTTGAFLMPTPAAVAMPPTIQHPTTPLTMPAMPPLAPAAPPTPGQMLSTTLPLPGGGGGAYGSTSAALPSLEPAQLPAAARVQVVSTIAMPAPTAPGMPVDVPVPSSRPDPEISPLPAATAHSHEVSVAATAGHNPPAIAAPVAAATSASSSTSKPATPSTPVAAPATAVHSVPISASMPVAGAVPEAPVPEAAAVPEAPLPTPSEVNSTAVAEAVANAARSAAPRTMAPFRGSKAAAAGLVANALANFSNAAVAARAAADAAVHPRAAAAPGDSAGSGRAGRPGRAAAGEVFLGELGEEGPREPAGGPAALARPEPEPEPEQAAEPPAAARGAGGERGSPGRAPGRGRGGEARSPRRRRGRAASSSESSSSSSRGRGARRGRRGGRGSRSRSRSAGRRGEAAGRWAAAGGTAAQRGPPAGPTLQVPDLLLPTGVGRGCDQAKLQAAQLAAARRLQVVPVAASAVRPGDWFCPICSAHNYASKFQCFRCIKGTNPLLDGSQGLSPAAGGFRGGLGFSAGGFSARGP